MMDYLQDAQDFYRIAYTCYEDGENTIASEQCALAQAAALIAIAERLDKLVEQSRPAVTTGGEHVQQT